MYGGMTQSLVIIYRGNTCLEELLSLLSSLIKRRLTGGKITQNSVIILREETHMWRDDLFSCHHTYG